MQGLTLDTDQNNASSPTQQPSQTHPNSSPTRSRSASPSRPTYSPITPTLGAARLATTSSSTAATLNAPQQQERVYTHTQPPQTFIPPPKPPVETVSLDTNPDALALKSAISILQIQQKRATSDIQTLQQIKERALADPAAFTDALVTGKLKTKPDALFEPPAAQDDSDEDDDSSDVEMPELPTESNGDAIMSDSAPSPAKSKTKTQQPWPHLPKPQNIVRTPPINWTQYGIVGDSLDKLHADTVARPLEGLPARIGAEGQIVPVEGGRRHDGLGVASPYNPGRDRVVKKGGKR